MGSPSASASAMRSRSACSNARMNSRPMILRFSSGSRDPGERVEERVDGVDRDEADAGGRDVVLLDLAPLVLAQQPVVDEHADELVADGLVHDRGGDRGVDAAREARDDAAGADLLADARDLLGDDVARVPVGGDARGAVQEVLDDPLALLGVLDLGVPLHAVEALLVVRERRDGGAVRGGEHLEALGRDGDRVAVAHPHGLVRRAGPPSRELSSSLRTVTAVAPYSRWPVCATSPPSCCAITWKP